MVLIVQDVVNELILEVRMITKKEYLEAQMTVKLYESQNMDIHITTRCSTKGCNGDEFVENNKEIQQADIPSKDTVETPYEVDYTANLDYLIPIEYNPMPKWK